MAAGPSASSPRPDSSKAQRELGWRPTPLKEGVRKTPPPMGLLETG